MISRRSLLFAPSSQNEARPCPASRRGSRSSLPALALTLDSRLKSPCPLISSCHIPEGPRRVLE